MKTPTILIIISFAILLLDACNNVEYSKRDDSPWAEKLDPIFSDWPGEDGPGGSVGVIKDGEILYSRSFGLASLEYEVPNENSTLYNIASVSKQFTAYAMLLLEDEGKIDLDDDIRKYLTELPDFGTTITIRNMLQHTSGLRSLHALLGLAGWRSDDSRNNEDLMRFMVRQTDLNFLPGDEYLYCNTGYIFSAIILERVTGQSFPDWMKMNVFNPLGMEDTYVEDMYNRVVPGNATSYYLDNATDSYQFSVPYWGYTGSGNIHTNIFDMFKWIEHIQRMKVDKERMFADFTRNAILNNGDTIDYALGINSREFEDHSMLVHGGSIGGYRASLAVLPDDGYGIVVLTNFSNSNPGSKMRQIARSLLEIPEPDVSDIQDSDDENDPESVEPNEEILQAAIGSYYSPEVETTYTIQKVDTGYVIYHPRHGYQRIEYVALDTLETDDIWIYLNRDERQNIDGIRITNGRVRNLKLKRITR